MKKLQAALDAGNQWIDEYLIKLKLKKRSPTELELGLTGIIQSFVLNLKSGLTLDQSLILSVQSSGGLIALNELFRKHPTPSVALLHYIQNEASENVKRFARLVEQNKKTGSSTLTQILDQFSNELIYEKFEQFKMHSEKVSLKLTFLLALSLISVIIIAIAPVMLSI